MLPFASIDSCLSIGEGNTILQSADGLASHLGRPSGNLFLQYEGLNPSGSFKDNGMATALTHGKLVGCRAAACASTGNTSASLAMFAATTGACRAIVFVGSGKIAYGKLSQALDYGALTLQIQGDFDAAMARVREIGPRLGIYLVNSVNPFRLEGQKTIILRILEGLDWEIPDWLIVPGGNLGNSSAFGKIFQELYQLRLIDRVPRMAIVNAQGASTLDVLVNDRGCRWNHGQFGPDQAASQLHERTTSGSRAKTVATAIEINLPVNLTKCLRAIEVTDGLVRSVADSEILDAKALVGRYGFGCEPASAASVAGLIRLQEEGLISRDDRVVCLLTGHVLKDPTATVGYHMERSWQEKNSIQTSYSNRPVTVPNEIDQIVEAIKKHSARDR